MEPDTLFRLRGPDETGLDFENTLTTTDSLNILNYLYFYNGGGVGIGDINNDGLEDLFFSGNLVSSRLYLNQGGLQFKDITEEAGIIGHGWCTGVSMVDINEDGFLDIYVSRAGSANREQRANLLYLNNGDMTFTESARSYGIDNKGFTTHSAFFDYDLDGDLDLYVMNHDIDRAALNTPIPRKLNSESPTTDVLYRNNGDQSFTDVSEEAGITIEGYGLGLGINDFNNDGFPDIYLANDFITNDIMYINNGNGTFTNQIASRVTEQSYNGMGVDIADFNNDEFQDIMVLDMLPPDPEREKTMAGSMTYDKFATILRMGYEPQFVRNTLHLNEGGNFREIGRFSGVHRTDWSWAPLFLDADGDGWKDLFISNGYLKDITDKDFVDYENNLSLFRDKDSTEKETLERIDALHGIKLSNYIYSNNRDLTFTDRTTEWGLNHESYSNGAAYGDLDNDGDLDIVTNNINASAFLFENRGSGNHFIRLEIEGPVYNPSAIGSKIKVYMGQDELTYFINPYRGFMSSMSPRQTIGVGSRTRIDSVKVHWMNGNVSCYHAVPVDQPLQVKFNDEAVCINSSGVHKIEMDTRQDIVIPGLDYETKESFYNEFKLQPLLPHKVSMKSPVLIRGDLNGDGLEDLFIGGGKEQPSIVYFQGNGRFEKTALNELNGQEVNDAVIADFSGDGINDLYVACGTPSLAPGDPLQFDRLFLGGSHLVLDNNHKGNPYNSTSVCALDIDKDGDLDLFIGCGPHLKTYPRTMGGILLINREGIFSDVSKSQPVELSSLGWINDVSPIDIDQDGWPDLAIASDWSPMVVLRNESGVIREKLNLQPDVKGFWKSLAVVDLDGDGDMDIIGGNAGLNGPLKADPEEPISMYISDLDGNGTMDPLVTHFVNGKETLLTSRAQLFSRYPFYSRRYTSHRSFAKAVIRDLIGEGKISSVERWTVTDMASKLFINEGGFNFNSRNLPDRMQLFSMASIEKIPEENDPEYLAFPGNEDFMFYDGQTFGRGSVEWIELEKQDLSTNNLQKYSPEARAITSLTINGYGVCMIFIDINEKLHVQNLIFE